MSRRDFFGFNTPVKTNDDHLKLKQANYHAVWVKNEAIEPNSEAAHELNKVDLEYAVKALEQIVKRNF